MSRHLRLLKNAGLVVDEPGDPARIYQLHDEGVAAVRAYLGAGLGARRRPASGCWPRTAALIRSAGIAGCGAEEGSVIEPLRLSFEVGARPEHAFAVWTARTSRWWPVSHTVTAEPGLRVTFEPRVGGRIFERAPSGGRGRLGRDHRLGRRPGGCATAGTSGPTAPTRRTSRSRSAGPGRGTTRVDIEHSGWERLGERGPGWRQTNHGGWRGVLPAYRAACAGSSVA